MELNRGDGSLGTFVGVHAGRVLAGTRNAVAWAALGHATAAYEAVGAPSRQAPGELPDRAGQAGENARRSHRDAAVLPAAGRLVEEGWLTDTIAALAKMNNTRNARQVCWAARDLLGGNGTRSTSTSSGT